MTANLPFLNAAMFRGGAVTPARKAALLATIYNESGFRADAVQAGTDAFRGRGFIQLTGQGNYRRAGTDIGFDLINTPGLAANPFVSAAVAGWYWTVARNINLAADRLDMGAVNIAIGYQPSGAEDIERCLAFTHALTWFNGGVAPAGINCARTPGSALLARATSLSPSSSSAAGPALPVAPGAPPTAFPVPPPPTSPTAPTPTTTPGEAPIAVPYTPPSPPTTDGPVSVPTTQPPAPTTAPPTTIAPTPPAATTPESTTPPSG
jgi:putative chitinase